jgi:hypothetical protein
VKARRTGADHEGQRRREEIEIADGLHRFIVYDVSCRRDG